MMNKGSEENIFAEERKHLIVELVNRQVKTTVSELCQEFGVSPATIRNDLRELEFAGLLKRTHGGAISNRQANYEPNSYQKQIKCIEEKIAIARVAASMVVEGDTIAIDTGSQTMEFAKRIVGVKHLTVVTHDIEIAAFLEHNSEANIIIPGGLVRRNFNCTLGPMTLQALENLSVDRCFLSSNGLSLQRGVTTPNMDMAKVKEMLIGLADEAILMSDSSKLGKAAFIKFADMTDIDVLITDEGADTALLEEFRQVDVSVEVASVPATN